MSYKSQHIGIIGRGLAGLFAAEKLAEAGFEVSVIHAETGEGDASPLAQGVICSKGLTAAESELFAAKLAGQEALFERLRGFPDIARIEGIIEPFLSEEACARILKRVYRKRPYSEAGTVRVTAADRPEALFQQTAVKGWLSYPRDFWFDGVAFLAALEAKLRREGVRFVAETVRCWEEHPDGWTVMGSRGTIVCDELVIATGAETDRLLVASGFPPLGLVPVHGVILRGSAGTPLPSCAFVHGAKSVVCHGSQIQIGGTSSKEWQAGDLEIHARALRDELFPLLSPSVLATVNWKPLHGVRVRLKDRMPVVGPWKRGCDGKAVYVLTGLYKSGLQLGEGCAAHLSQVMKGLPPPEQTKTFDARRLN